MSFTPLTFVLARALPGQLPTTSIPAIHLYGSATDTISTISASGYFNSLIPTQFLPPHLNVSGGFNDNQIEVGDLILVVDSTNTPSFLEITATHPNVTTVAMNATIPPGSIGTAQLQDGAVTTAKLANLAVTAAKIANNTITSTQLAPAAVGTSNIANSAITKLLLAPSLYTQTGFSPVTFDGPFTVTANGSYSGIIFADFKILTFTGVSGGATHATFATMGATLPAPLQPTTTFIGFLSAIDGSGVSEGSVQVTTGGAITLGVGGGVGNFTGSGNAGWAAFSIIYT